MSKGRRITGVVLVALAVALAVTSIFVPWMVQERTVQDCSDGPCTNEEQTLSYYTTGVVVDGDQRLEFLYGDLQDRAGLGGDDVQGALFIQIGLISLIVAASLGGLTLLFGLISLADVRPVAILGTVTSVLAALAAVLAIAMLLVGIDAFQPEAEELAVDGTIVEEDGLVASFGVGLAGAAFFAVLFGGILLPFPRPEPDVDTAAFYVPGDDAGGTGGDDAAADDGAWDASAWEGEAEEPSWEEGGDDAAWSEDDQGWKETEEEESWDDSTWYEPEADDTGDDGWQPVEDDESTS